MSDQKKRYTIGLLGANIIDGYSNKIAKGAMRAAKRLNADLIIFPGKYLGPGSKYDSFDITYEYQYNVMFDHAAHAGLDYIICVAGSIGYMLNDDERNRFLEKFSGTPLLSIAFKTDKCDYLQYDNKSGIIEAVDLLAAEGRKHIGMMIGEPNNSECRERYSAYRYALEKNGLEFHENYIVESELTEYCHKEAAELLEKAPELDGIICANDALAKVIYVQLENRHKKIGTEVAVVGFDDNPYAAEMTPPLASVRADTETLGERAVERAVNFLDGKPETDHELRSEFVPRQSCIRDSGSFDLTDKVFSGDKNSFRSDISSYLKAFGKDHDTVEKQTEVISAIAEHIFDAIENKGDAVKETEALLKKYQSSSAVFGKEYKGLYELLLSGKKALRKRYPDNIDTADDLYTLLSVRLSSCITRYIGSADDRIKEKTHVDNIFIRDTLMLNDDIETSYAKILHRLVNVGADTGFIYLFDNPIQHRGDTAFPDNPDWRFKSYSYGAKTFTISADEQKIPAHEVYKNKYLCADRQHIFIAADLFSADTQYGIALLEPKDADFFDEFEMVTYQLSLAIRQLHSSFIAQQSLKRQEKLLEELHSRNLALEELSNIDELTGINNRRGFYMLAGELVREQPGQKFIVGYADMDRLKYVNDNYGHEEGDFCIRLVSECFREALGEKAIIGRVGGDEFIGIVKAEDTDGASEIYSQRNSFVNIFNSSGKKPYPFGVSMGLVECELHDSYDLKSAVDRADDLLYVEKSRKKVKRKII
ncbi:MAG: GGDEF domain-containing protein [Ruminococcus sp.]|nr:GGDEF domain-containing protein [Ruminococcus sp.]